ncbi:MAG TPA: hypothetical protein PK411_11935 [Mesotoga infera]|jgi:hypothetical protein|nr:hypothetical protein [Mesotoga infera]HRR45130.1 hypothetical protein [Mesotoga sp.]HNS67315.1 hypothetical protein [Mesotoga infera]HOI35256.1 hypothetical protein [Mesotoga infera]HPD39044.1 hypothetical protein [Mesotoga infera]
MKKILALFIIVLPVALAGINVELDLGHLEFLRDEFDIEGSVEAGYWIYADRQPDGSYRHAQAPGEGVTCVDDVARAAILYLRLFEKSADESHYLKAREALDFLLAMQDVDGDFFNFIFADGKINRNGPTSRKGGNWWAARGLWALSTGAWVLSQRDPSYSMELARASHKAFRVLLNYERDGLIQGYTDISSVALLGAVELYRISNDLEVLNFIKRCSGSLRSKLITDKDSIFRGLVDENAPQENVPNWHGWGSRQLEALAMTALALEDDELLGLAADAFKDGAMLLLSTGPVYSLSGFVQLFPQIAYAAEAAISTGYTLFSITNDREIATITALLGSWFIGLNSLGQSMIGPNGEGYDGMEFSHINRNAGAESTISMLLSLERLSRLPDEYEKYFSGTIELLTPAKVIEAEAMRTGLSEVDTFQGTGISGNAALKVSGVFSLRESVALPPVPYSAFAGVGNVQTGPVSFTLRLGESRSEVTLSIAQNSIFKVGGITGTGQDSTLTLGGKVGSGSFDLDQLVLLPDLIALYIPESDETLVLNHRAVPGYEEGMTVLPGRIVSTERKIVQVPTVAVDLIENLDQVHLDLRALFDNDGLATADERKSSNFDNPQGIFGASYPAQELEKSLIDGRLEISGVEFAITTKGRDNMRLTGQAVTFVPEVFSRICILGSANHGDYTGQAMLVYKDGTTQNISVSFSDWCGGPSMGEDIAFTFPSRYDNTGNIERIKCMLYYRCVETLDRPLKTIVFPQIPNVHIFAITLRRK